MDQAVRIFLVLGIIIMVLYLYANIVPCKKSKNNNTNNHNNNMNVENFALPIELTDVIHDRTRALKGQVVKSNILGQDISRTLREIELIKNKVKMIIDESDSSTGKTYMINTNGEISEETQ